mmetsp:Transcript_12128/g.25114  ORF Transcript_12128/g.25114 Transcript_12128/m.25114 type:complete len:124 (+) Transcript_12128:183-554(+)
MCFGLLAIRCDIILRMYVPKPQRIHHTQPKMLDISRHFLPSVVVHDWLDSFTVSFWQYKNLTHRREQFSHAARTKIPKVKRQRQPFFTFTLSFDVLWSSCHPLRHHPPYVRPPQQARAPAVRS